MATTASLIIINGVDGYRTGIGLARKNNTPQAKEELPLWKVCGIFEWIGWVCSLVFSNLGLGSVRFYLNKIKDRAVWWCSKQFEDSYTIFRFLKNYFSNYPSLLQRALCLRPFYRTWKELENNKGAKIWIEYE